MCIAAFGASPVIKYCVEYAYMNEAQFVAMYPGIPPAKKPENSDELIKISASEGVQLHGARPVTVPDKDRNIPEKAGEQGCHLWVIDSTGIPFILERAPVSRGLQSGRITHTNLTGGRPASCGGEIWFAPSDDDLVYMNGCSGRYGPKSERQLEDAESVMISYGYKVIGFGWDPDADRPAKVMRK